MGAVILSQPRETVSMSISNRSIALLNPNNDGNYLQINRAILDYAAAAQWRVMPHFEFLSDSDMPLWLKTVDGVIAHIPTAKVGRKLKALKVPVVNLYIRDFLPGAPRFEHSTSASVTAAIDFFQQAGCRRLAYCGDAGFALSSGQDSFFTRICRERGLESHLFFPAGEDQLAVNGYDYSSRTLGQFIRDRKLLRWLIDLPKPIGIICCNDALGAVVINRCLERGIAVPGEVSVLGIGGMENQCLSVRPSLSCLNYKTFELGRAAAGLLDDLLHGRPVPPVTTILPDAVIERESTGTVFTSDPLVRQALLRIEAGFASGMNIKSLCEEIGCTRLRMERGFIKEMGKTPGAVLLDRKMKAAQELLANSRLSVAEIAGQCAFNDSAYFCNLFKRRLGLSPSAWRQQRRGY